MSNGWHNHIRNAIVDMPEPTQRYPSISRNDQPVGEVHTTPSVHHTANARSPKHEERLDMETCTAKVYCAVERKADVSTGTGSVKCKPREHHSADAFTNGLGAYYYSINQMVNYGQSHTHQERCHAQSNGMLK